MQANWLNEKNVLRKSKTLPKTFFWNGDASFLVISTRLLNMRSSEITIICKCEIYFHV